MISKIKKEFFVALLLILFASMALVQSLFFSKESDGVINIDKKIEAPFIKSNKKVILLFFGYVGCVDVCTPILLELNELYESKEFKVLRDRVDFVFVNLTPKIDKYQPQLFAEYFNENFHGVYLSKKELMSIDRDFGLFFSQSLSDKSELNHTDHIYLLINNKNDKILKQIYTSHPLNKRKLIHNINMLI